MSNPTGKKLCKHCKTEIPADAKICPNCRKKQGIGCLPVIIIAVVVIIAIAAFGSSSSDESAPVNKIDNSGANNTPTASQTTENTGSGDTAEENDVSAVQVGGTYTGSDVKFTVNSYDPNYIVKNDEYGLYNPDPGFKYIAVNFTFENVGKSDKYVSINDFDCYADNSSCEQTYLTPDAGDFINVNLSSGRTVSFTTYYSVPEDASVIELEYTANIWTDEKIVVRLQ